MCHTQYALLNLILPSTWPDMKFQCSWNSIQVQSERILRVLDTVFDDDDDDDA